ncbi:MAG: efflux RND transporter periplasmic adaptor subunit [Pseudomonadales bacterium]
MNRFGAVLTGIALLVMGGCGDAGTTAGADGEAGDPHGHAESSARSVRIDPDMAAAAGVITAVAGPGVIDEAVTVYGTVTADPTAVREVIARYPGIARTVRVAVGDTVTAGSVLVEVESDESLNRYTLTAPIAGTVTERMINPGEHTGTRALFRIVDARRVWGELALFPADRPRIDKGARVDVYAADGTPLGTAEIDWIGLATAADQSVTARVTLDNPQGRMVSGQHLTGRIHVAVHEADLVIERAALQTLDADTVVFVQEGDIYSARTLRTGRQDGQRIEVLEGLQAGEVYVSGNSYLIKADMEKADAGHEH